MSRYLFVYGTLKRGRCRHRFLEESEYKGQATTVPRYRLMSVHGEYPALIPIEQPDEASCGVGVRGEVYRIEDRLFELLDVVEGVEEDLFERRNIQLLNFEEEVESYFWLGGIDDLDDVGSEW